MERDLSALRHEFVPLRNGKSEVIILDQGSVIGPEAGAMLGALYSRSPASVRKHLADISERGPEKFMSTYYVKYGHKSIGDMGTAYAFIENVSLLAAKAVQDFPLYNGQECSTRYIDYSTSEFIDPSGSARSQAMLERLRAFYLRILTEMIPVLKERNPIQEGKKVEDYEKAIKALAFDIARAFLPGGASTSLVWSGEIRQFGDRLPVLRNHPLKEVCDIGEALEKGLINAYPSSFSGKRYGATEQYLKEMGAQHAYFDPLTFPEFEAYDSGLDRRELSQFMDALVMRPMKTELPYAIRDAGTMKFEYLMDFGSYRDNQRHRALAIRMPLLTTRFGFEQWYLNQLTDELRSDAQSFLTSYLEDLALLGLTPEEEQYLVPIGYRVPVREIGDLRALCYFVELRVDSTVHATMRSRAKQVAETLLQILGDSGLVLHLGADPDSFNVKRGTQDIVKKE